MLQGVQDTPCEHPSELFRFLDHPVFDFNLGLATKHGSEHPYNTLIREDFIDCTLIAQEWTFFDIDMIASQ